LLKFGLILTFTKFIEECLKKISFSLFFSCNLILQRILSVVEGVVRSQARVVWNAKLFSHPVGEVTLVFKLQSTVLDEFLHQHEFW